MFMFLLLLLVVKIPIDLGRREASQQKLGRGTIGRWYRLYLGIGFPANEVLATFLYRYRLNLSELCEWCRKYPESS